MQFEEYVRDILADIPAHVRHLPILAGGALRAFYDGTTPKDYDLFFRSKADYEIVLEAMRGGLVEKPQEYPGVHVLVSESGREFNLVGFAFSEPLEQIFRFDFRCSAVASWMDAHGFIWSRSVLGAIEDAKSKRLVVMNNNGDEREYRRIRRYIDEYGYTLEDHQAEEEQPDTDVPVGTYAHVMRVIRKAPRGGGGYGA